MSVSVDGGGQPKWRGDGRELFYTTPGNLLMSAAVRAAGERLEVSLPTKLLQIRDLQGARATVPVVRLRRLSCDRE